MAQNIIRSPVCGAVAKINIAAVARSLVARGGMPFM
jgi:hypothetical protein